MRRSEYTYYRKELREKLLEYETQVTPMIQEKLLRNGQDAFHEGPLCGLRALLDEQD